jgi:hypothetical protein
MYTMEELALSRPKHVFDLPALTIWTLALAGALALRSARALDAHRALNIECGREGPGRRRPYSTSIERSGLPETWRLR